MQRRERFGRGGDGQDAGSNKFSPYQPEPRNPEPATSELGTRNAERHFSIAFGFVVNVFIG
jgi:hypothetical protein